MNDFSVIINDEAHNLTNEDAEKMRRRYVADSVAFELGTELEARIKDELGVTAEVTVPWYENGEDIVFDIIKVVADCSSEKCRKIETWIQLHYSLKSECSERGG